MYSTCNFGLKFVNLLRLIDYFSYVTNSNLAFGTQTVKTNCKYEKQGPRKVSFYAEHCKFEMDLTLVIQTR